MGLLIKIVAAGVILAAVVWIASVAFRPVLLAVLVPGLLLSSIFVIIFGELAASWGESQGIDGPVLFMALSAVCGFGIWWAAIVCAWSWFDRRRTAVRGRVRH